MNKYSYIFIFCLAIAGCMDNKNKADGFKVRLITLDPGHFHAALVQKTMYPDIDPDVSVYAPAGADVEQHLQKIKAYNGDKDHPTSWKEHVYLGEDFLSKMIQQKKGNVVILAGNNQHKTQYIKQSLDAGFNVLADKPMAIDAANFETLQQAFASAASKKLLLYDIMTERFEITTMLQKAFAQIPQVFGTLEKGTPDRPAVEQSSTHFFYKYVSGKVLTRPIWFFDIAQQGEGIADVGTHLVDLVQWMSFPDQVIDFKKDIQVNKASHWPTNISLEQFKTLTGANAFPAFLSKYALNDTAIAVLANGEINYRLKGVYARVTVKWEYQPSSPGGGDTHDAVMRGSKASLEIRQGAQEQYKPTLYIVPNKLDSQYAAALMEQLKTIQSIYPGVALKKIDKGWQVQIPQKYEDGHEAHFARVTRNYLAYLQKSNMPAWERPNMIAKYYTTIKALELAKSGK